MRTSCFERKNVDRDREVGQGQAPDMRPLSNRYFHTDHFWVLRTPLCKDPYLIIVQDGDLTHWINANDGSFRSRSCCSTDLGVKQGTPYGGVVFQMRALGPERVIFSIWECVQFKESVFRRVCLRKIIIESPSEFLYFKNRWRIAHQLPSSCRFHQTTRMRAHRYRHD